MSRYGFKDVIKWCPVDAEPETIHAEVVDAETDNILAATMALTAYVTTNLHGIVCGWLEKMGIDENRIEGPMRYINALACDGRDYTIKDSGDRIHVYACVVCLDDGLDCNGPHTTKGGSDSHGQG